MWKWLTQQQQRGAQLPRGAAASAEATRGRSAQKNDEADQQLGGVPRSDIDYPATNPPERHGDITPSAPDPHVEWDDIVQPERAPEQARDDRDDQPLPEGK